MNPSDGMTRVGIGLGSNLGDRCSHLRSALVRLRSVRATSHLLLSPVFETEPVDCPPGSPSFYNAVVEIETLLSPAELLSATQQIERILGRPELRAHNAPRTIDLDLLYYGTLSLQVEHLVLPHPRMHERAFVLKPLHRIRPDLVPAHALPLLGDTSVVEIAADWWP